MATRCNFMMDVKRYFITCSRLLYDQHLVATRRNLMMDVKMHFITCLKFLANAKIWWPQGVIWMFNLYVFCCFPKIFCCDEKLDGH